MKNQAQSRNKKVIKVGNIKIGGNNPVVIQSMTNTLTKDVQKTVNQIKRLQFSGCQLIRLAVVDKDSAKAIKNIKKLIKIPLVADIHFDYKLAIASIENGADKIRINPGNIKNKTNLKKIIKKAKEYKIPIRIGVNSGSLETDILKKFGRPNAQALVHSIAESINFFEKNDFDQIVLSLKHSQVDQTIKAYEIAYRQFNYPLHLGVTEAGTLLNGTIKSAIAFGVLLNQKIGDTIRVSLSEDPVKEIEVAKKILGALNLRKDTPSIISCPTCGRCEIDVVGIAKRLEKKIKNLDKNIKIAVMGCLVNGPGEAKQAHIGVCGIDSNSNYVMLFKKGRLLKKIKAEEIENEILKEID
ncbi:MAG: flavodoxin-dependent (E)-4-hydroxy-3-methylbut-2-enyl-diphosphate synthase [Candidatus Moranbacteria bacterium]|nr:flavodoxin-dependent (E)-4-hydroxy-3-methylbut-2-enyl-diphosphate synthase [Candidatus Moranbacteria bacterium]